MPQVNNMDLRFHVSALRELRQLVSGAQSARGVRAVAETRRADGCMQRPNRRPDTRVCGVHTGDRGRSGRDRRDQGSTHHGAYRRRARAAADNCTAQRRICLRKQSDQGAEDAIFHPVCASLRQTSSKDRDREGVAMAKHPLFGCDRSRNHESGSVKRRKVKTLALVSSHETESSSCDESSSSSIFSTRERREGNVCRAPKIERDRDRDSGRAATRSDPCSTQADSCAQAASTDVVRSALKSKLPSRVRGVDKCRSGAFLL